MSIFGSNKEPNPTDNVPVPESIRQVVAPEAGARMNVLFRAVEKVNMAATNMNSFMRNSTPEQATGFIATSTITEAPAAVMPTSADTDTGLFDDARLGYAKFDPSTNVIDHNAEAERARQATEAAYAQPPAQPIYPEPRSEFHAQVEAGIGDRQVDDTVVYAENLRNEIRNDRSAAVNVGDNPLLLQARQATEAAYPDPNDLTLAA